MQPTGDGDQFPPLRTMIYRLDFTTDRLRDFSAEIVTFNWDGPLEEIPHINLVKPHKLKTHGGSQHALLRYAMACRSIANAPAAEVVRFLTGPEAVVPQFGSPPQSFVSLESVVAQGVGTLAAIGAGGGIPTLFVAYLGGVVLVHFINPVVAEAGRAVGDGVGDRIRRAFGLPSALGGAGGAAQESQSEPSPPPDSEATE